jgi:hypothetical protein
VNKVAEEKEKIYKVVVKDKSGSVVGTCYFGAKKPSEKSVKDIEKQQGDFHKREVKAKIVEE